MGREEKGRGKSKSQSILKNTRRSRGLKIRKYYKKTIILRILHHYNHHITHYLVNAFNAHIKQKRMWVDNETNTYKSAYLLKQQAAG